MKKLLLTAAAACAIAAPAFAEESGLSFSGNIALTTDYVFRGISQTNGSPAVQGGFDAAYGQFYAGVWASSLDFTPLPDAPIETDFYVGYKPVFGPVSTDFGVIGYFYPGAKDKLSATYGGGNYDYGEIYAKASFAPAEPWTVGGAVYYSPEFFGETGSAWYVEANTAYVLTPELSVSGALGYQKVEKINYGDLADLPSTTDNYTTWNVGGTYSLSGFSFDLRYSGTDISDDFGDTAKDRVAFSVKRAL